MQENQVSHQSRELTLALGFIKENKNSIISILFEASLLYVASLEDDKEQKESVAHSFNLLKEVVLEC